MRRGGEVAGRRGIVGYRNEEEAAAAFDKNFPVWLIKIGSSSCQACAYVFVSFLAKWPNLWLNSFAVNGKFKAKKKQNAVCRTVCSRKAGILCKRV